MSKKRVTNAGEPYDVKLRSNRPGKCRVEVETDKHTIRFELDWWNLSCLSQKMWEYLEDQQEKLDSVKQQLRGEL